PLDLPGHRRPVAGDAPVLKGRDLGGEDRDVVALGVEGDQWLVEDPRTIAVLHADGQVGGEDGRPLPPEDLHVPPPSPPPPPPRRVGARAGRLGALACRATPWGSSISAANGAVSPAPTIIRVNWRRVKRPSLTRPIQ